MTARLPVPLPATPRRPRRFALTALVTVNSAVVAGAIACSGAPIETAFAAFATAIATSAAMQWRVGPIKASAERVCRAYLFGDGLCADEIRELAKVTLYSKETAHER